VSNLDELQKLKALFDDGAISQEEYERVKASLLDATVRDGIGVGKPIDRSPPGWGGKGELPENAKRWALGTLLLPIAVAGGVAAPSGLLFLSYWVGWEFAGVVAAAFLAVGLFLMVVDDKIEASLSRFEGRPTWVPVAMLVKFFTGFLWMAIVFGTVGVMVGLVIAHQSPDTRLPMGLATACMAPLFFLLWEKYRKKKR